MGSAVWVSNTQIGLGTNLACAKVTGTVFSVYNGRCVAFTTHLTQRRGYESSRASATASVLSWQIIRWNFTFTTINGASALDNRSVHHHFIIGEQLQGGSNMTGTDCV